MSKFADEPFNNQKLLTQAIDGQENVTQDDEEEGQLAEEADHVNDISNDGQSDDQDAIEG